jgi:hypothetical protein
MVWVETSFLRHFLSCEKLLCEDFEQKIVLQHRKLLCSHRVPGLHPRVARRGKLLPKPAFDAYIDTIQEEIITIVGNECSEWEVIDCEITLSKNLICEDCMHEYKQELGQTLKHAKRLKYLHNELDPKEMKFSRNLDVDEIVDSQTEQYAYMVSRKFITWFRNNMVRLMKHAGTTIMNQNFDLSSSMSSISVAEGLDGLNVSEFCSANFLPSSSSTIDDEGIVVRVNGPLTCK